MLNLKLSQISYVDGDNKVYLSISPKGNVELKIGNSHNIKSVGFKFLFYDSIICAFSMERILFTQNTTEYIYKRLYSFFEIKNK